MTDVFGIALQNNLVRVNDNQASNSTNAFHQLLADDYAKNGFQVCTLSMFFILTEINLMRPLKTYVPDYLHDDPVPADFLGGKVTQHTYHGLHIQLNRTRHYDDIV